MDQFMENVTAPDNIPIVLLLLILAIGAPVVFFLARARYPLGHDDAEGKLHTWPFLLRIEFVAAILVFAGLMVWSITIDAPLESRADPTETPNPAKAPWYFVGLQELLVYFDPWIAGVMLPGLIILGLMLLPYLDVNPKGNGHYAFRERRFAVSTFLFGFLGLWVLMIGIGTFCRGPGWMWFWPWETWDAHKRTAETLRNFHEVFGVADGAPAVMLGVAALAGFYALAMGLPYALLRRRRSKALAELRLPRYMLVSFFVASMGGVVVKVVLRHVLDVRYVLITPWFNI